LVICIEVPLNQKEIKHTLKFDALYDTFFIQSNNAMSKKIGFLPYKNKVFAYRGKFLNSCKISVVSGQ